MPKPHCDENKSYKTKNTAASTDGISETVAGSWVSQVLIP